MVRSVFLVAALVLAGCQSDSAPDASGEAPAQEPIAEMAPEADAEMPVDGGGLVLEMDGLGLVGFGASMDDAIAVIAEMSGEPTDTGENPECGAGPLTYASWDSGLTLYGSEGAFAGWFLADGTVMTDLGTPEALALGSTRTDLESAYTADVFESSLGMEFYAVPLGESTDTGDAWYAGLLDGDGPDAGVETMWAGTICSFR